MAIKTRRVAGGELYERLWIASGGTKIFLLIGVGRVPSRHSMRLMVASPFKPSGALIKLTIGIFLRM